MAQIEVNKEEGVFYTCILGMDTVILKGNYAT